MLTRTLHCPHCGSDRLTSNGHARNGKLRFRCSACGRYGREAPGSNAYSEARKAEILAAYHQRASIRGLSRVFGASRNTVSAWLKKAEALPPLERTLVPAMADEPPELNELQSFVARRKDKRRVWLALCRRTRQVVACAVGYWGRSMWPPGAAESPTSSAGAASYGRVWPASCARRSRSSRARPCTTPACVCSCTSTTGPSAKRTRIHHDTRRY